jgi:cellulose biosynthesis protein BcsQ
MNLAAALAESGKRVLIVDSDPQCNMTSYLIQGDVVDSLLDESDGPAGRTVWSAVKRVSEGEGSYRAVEPIETSIENLFVIPGDIALAEFERDLIDFWGQAFQRRPKGFKGTAALSELVNVVSAAIQADYVFYDSGPNIGALNRAIVLDCDHLIVPVACDLFSLRALKTLGRTLLEWISSWSTVRELVPDGMYVPVGKPAFLGYVPTGFRVYGGQIAQAPAAYLGRIEREIHSQIISLLRTVDSGLAVGSLRSFKLGEIQNFSGLIPASQELGLPLWGTKAGTAEQRAGARHAFESLAKRVEVKTSGG